MHVVSIANFILLASSVNLCALRLNNIGVASTGGGLPELRLSLGSTPMRLRSNTGATDWRQPVAEMVSKRTPHAMS